MSEQQQSFMQQLDAWTEQVISGALLEDGIGLNIETGLRVKQAIREKVLESYKNGCKAGAGHVRRDYRADREEMRHA
jgi:hypothetical protein